MKDAKNSRSAGFSLIEVLTAITVLGLMIAPIGASLVLSHRLNARSQELMEAQLAVSSAVETLMAEGVTEALDAYRPNDFPEVGVKTEQAGAAYKVTVSSSNTDLDVVVETYIRPAPETGGEPSG